MSYLNSDELTAFTASCGCTNYERCVKHEVIFQREQKAKKENLLEWISTVQGFSIPIFLFGFGLIGVADLVGAKYPLIFMLAGLVVGIVGLIMELCVKRNPKR